MLERSEASQGGEDNLPHPIPVVMLERSEASGGVGTRSFKLAARPPVIMLEASKARLTHLRVGWTNPLPAWLFMACHALGKTCETTSNCTVEKGVLSEEFIVKELLFYLSGKYSGDALPLV